MARVPMRASARAVFGGPLPPVILVFIVATFTASIVGAVGMRHGFPLWMLCTLDPTAVLHGQLWRLFTWIFFEDHPLSLVFSCLLLVWFGRDLAHRWGSTRFVLYYMGLAALVGAITAGLSVLYPPLREGAWAGNSPPVLALVLCWATYYPTRQFNFFFVSGPLQGRVLVFLTLAGTVLYAFYSGIEPLVPHFLAEGVALVAMRLPSPRALWIERKLRGVERQRRAGHLKIVPREERRDPNERGRERPPGGRWLN